MSLQSILLIHWRDMLYLYIFDFNDSVKFYDFGNSVRVAILPRYSALLSRVFS